MTKQYLLSASEVENFPKDSSRFEFRVATAGIRSVVMQVRSGIKYRSVSLRIESTGIT